MALAFRTLLKALPPSATALDLAFDQGVVDSKVTFTRASTATYTNSAGVNTSAAVDAPRIDYDPVTLACRGLLIEEQRTNLSASSELSTEGVTGTGTLAFAGDSFGAAKWQRLTATTISASPRVETSGGIPNGTTQTASIVVRRGTSRYAGMGIYTGASDLWALFDFDTQTMTITGSSAGYTASCTWEPAGPVGAYKLTYTVANASGSTSTTAFKLGVFSNSAGSSIVAPGDYLDIACRQVEVGSFATSYIPTTGATATRAADVAVISGANFSGFYNSAAGSVVVEAQTSTGTPASTYKWAAFSDGSTNNRTLTIFQAGGGNLIVARHVVAAADTSPSGSPAITLGSLVKAGMSATVGAAAWSVNGSTAGTSAPASMPAVNSLGIGTDETATGQQPNFWVRRLRYYPRALSQAELNALTS
jgi:hypothetical protein